MQSERLLLKDVSANLLVYGVGHATVDATCAAILFTIFKHQSINFSNTLSYLILYNVLAFGLQALLGLAVDHFQSPRAAALLGCMLVGISALVLSILPVIAIIFAGIGNALFHVGGGSISLNLRPRKAALPGMYVAPGALGLYIGTILGKKGYFIAWPCILIFVVLSLLIFVIRKPEMNYEHDVMAENQPNHFEIILFLILLSIAVRSLVGLALVFPWKADSGLLIFLTLAIMLGKGLGGILADKYGWLRVGVGAVAFSIPLLIFGAQSPYLALLGMFLFNITMPLTLVIISNILPGRPGFAFGLTCLALIMGALPVFTELKHFFGTPWIVFFSITISILSLYYGLRRYIVNY